jgi:hypothetical protein
MSTEEHNPQTPAPGREADERLVHALLLHVYDEQAAGHREQRVRQVMHAIGSRPTPDSKVGGVCAKSPDVLRFRTWTRRLLAAAAVILIAIGIWALYSSPAPAMASLNEVIAALGRPGDRTFRIRMEDLPEPPGRRPPDDHGPVPKPGLDDATLYLRDSRQYVLVRHDPNGGLIYDGFDGQQSWRVRNGIVAETRQGLGAGGIPMPAIMADVPFSDLPQTLARIRVDYKIEQLGRSTLVSGGELLRYLRIRRNSRWVKGPETIEIWADPKTSMPRRIIFDRAKIRGNQAPCRLTFDLTSEDSLPQNWFAPAAHATEGRRSGGESSR